MSKKEKWVTSILLAVTILTIIDISPESPNILALYYRRVGLLFLVAVIGYFIINNVYGSLDRNTEIEKWNEFRKKGLVMNVGRISLAIFIYLILLIGGGQYIFYGQNIWLTILSLQIIDTLIILLILGIFSLLASIVMYYEMERKYNNTE